VGVVVVLEVEVGNLEVALVGLQAVLERDEEAAARLNIAGDVVSQPPRWTSRRGGDTG